MHAPFLGLGYASTVLTLGQQIHRLVAEMLPGLAAGEELTPSDLQWVVWGKLRASYLSALTFTLAPDQPPILFCSGLGFTVSWVPVCTLNNRSSTPTYL